MSIEIDSFYNFPLASNPSRPCKLATPVVRSTIISFFINRTNTAIQAFSMTQHRRDWLLTMFSPLKLVGTFILFPQHSVAHY
jgi:hypothetical protein